MCMDIIFCPTRGRGVHIMRMRISNHVPPMCYWTPTHKWSIIWGRATCWNSSSYSLDTRLQLRCLCSKMFLLCSVLLVLGVGVAASQEACLSDGPRTDCGKTSFINQGRVCGVHQSRRNYVIILTDIHDRLLGCWSEWMWSKWLLLESQRRELFSIYYGLADWPFILL